MILALVAGGSALAQEPTPDGDVFADDDVQVEAIGSTWRITVRGRVLEVEVPKTGDDRALIEALVQSLLAELRLPAPETTPAPPPPSGLVAPRSPTQPPGPPPAPSHPLPQPPGDHAEAVPLPSSPAPTPGRPVAPSAAAAQSEPMPLPARSAAWHLWMGGGATTRPRLAPAGRIVAGAAYGRARGARVRVGWDGPRATRFADDTRLSAVDLDLAMWSSLGPSRFEVGAGLSRRAYRLAEEPVARHVAPFLTLGLGLVGELGAWTIAPFLGGTVDLSVTDIVLAGDDAVLSPVSAWLELRIGRRP